MIRFGQVSHYPLRQEAGDKLRVTIISPGFVKTPFVDTVANAEVKAQLAASRDKTAIEQPAEVDVNEIIVRPTAQG